jgi:type I restriction-modification system DNA methylase subunit
MDKHSAIKLIKDTFQNPFDKGRYFYFIKNLLNHIEETPSTIYRGNIIPDAYEKYIHTLDRIGKYQDSKGKKIDILIVHLKKETSLERARTMQRNFIAWYLNGSRGGKLKEAALVAFVSPDQEDWRFSLVKMDYRLDTSGETVKVKQELTPARRFSFLVGRNENSHTAQIRLVPLLIKDEHNPLLNELEDAFSVEKVTKEFFEKYRDLFLRVKDSLNEVVTANKKISEDFTLKNVNTVDFAKKLLGQIVFLYFLQKKGWFGVERDAAWGTGPKNFLRQLFEKKHGAYKNFFNDILELLFYEALAKERDDAFYGKFNCKIPFLNGGLFDPINNYDWVHTDILLPDELFSNNIKTKEGDIGTGILDVFDRYNFTVKEDEPLEREVAVDPEMLGKVFENLLEVKDRKSKGTYYTPREIVHYMCQESLINYLDTALNMQEDHLVRQKVVQKKLIGDDEPEQPGLTVPKYKSIIPREDIESFIRYGDLSIEHDRRVEKAGRETKDYSYRLPESIRKNARSFDDALKSIKICDPAIGSGAFPVGMMHEIVRARETLTTYISPSQGNGTTRSDDEKSPLPLRERVRVRGNERTPYNFKRHVIQNSIYGVDIDPGAIEIAKLRLWLSLVVDENDYRTIKSLPNLDYKIVCGNSLLGVERNLLNNHLFKELEELKQQYFEETSSGKKKVEKEKIDELIRQITDNDEHFDFEVYFSEVFHEHSNNPHFSKGGQGGFDVVVANPPYIRHESIKEIKKELAKKYRDFYCGTADIYTYFYKCGLEVLKPGGHLCFIAPNKFMRAGYGKNTRNLLATQATPKVIIDFCDLPIFDATTYPSILLLEKRIPDAKEEALAATFTKTEQLERLEETLEKIGFPMPVTSLKPEGWNLARPEVLGLMEKLRSVGTPLGEYVQGRFYRGVLTGRNKAFVIDRETRKQLIAEDPKSEELIKPWLRGRDIKKWKAEWAGLYVIFTRRGTDIERYPAIKKYLEQFREDLEPKKSSKQKRGRKPGSYKWYEIQDSIDYFKEFERPKIIYPNITKTNTFAFDSTGTLTNQKCFIISVDDLYLLAILNSKLTTQWFFSTLPLLRGRFFEPSAIFMQHFPVFRASESQKVPIVERAKKILADPDNSDVSHIEKEINKMIYKLYELTPEEIEIVDGTKKGVYTLDKT